MRQNKKPKQTLESAQYRLEISLKFFLFCSYCFVCFMSLVSVTGSYTEDEPYIGESYILTWPPTVVKTWLIINELVTINSLRAGSHLGAHARAAKSEFKSEVIL